jgi:SAM-dependent methyltransferase
VRDRAARFDLSHLARRLLEDLLPPPAQDPRWGNTHRDRKAEAIWTTLANCEGVKIGEGAWLDIGCGSGRIARELAARVHSVIGIDPEPWSGWREMEVATPNLSFRVASCDGAALPVAPESVDVVVCNQVYEHVGDPRQLIRNIADVLKPGGVCYFAGPNLLWPIEPHVFWPIVHWLPRRIAQRLMRLFGSKRTDELDAFSTHYWQLRSWFLDAGLAPSVAVAARVDSEFAARRWRVRLPRWLATVVDGLAPLSPGFVCILRKP